MISFSQRDVLFLLVVLLASLVVLALVRFARSRCPYGDPLCRRNRPCLGCYRKLFSDVKVKDQ